MPKGFSEQVIILEQEKLFLLYLSPFEKWGKAIGVALIKHIANMRIMRKKTFSNQLTLLNVKYFASLLQELLLEKSLLTLGAKSFL